jgi:hypothetical protein
MKLRGYMATLLTFCLLTSFAVAQGGMSTPPTEQYVPRLGDIMNAVQFRHMKLWLGGNARNWELAAYELRQLESGLMEAATLYPGIPATNVTRMSDSAKVATVRRRSSASMAAPTLTPCTRANTCGGLQPKSFSTSTPFGRAVATCSISGTDGEWRAFATVLPWTGLNTRKPDMTAFSATPSAPAGERTRRASSKHGKHPATIGLELLRRGV